MAFLNVSALSEDTIAAPGNRQANYLTVSVTNASGVPVTGLTSANFQVDPMIVGPGGSLIDIVSATAGRLPGFYLIRVVPINTQTWKSGVYLFAVAVNKGHDQGQALASVLMD